MRTARIWQVGSCVAAFWCSAGVAVAYNGLHRGQANGSFAYAVNEDSFNTELNGLTVSDAQARFWIRHSLAQWRERAGLDLGFTELGDTPLGDTYFDCFEEQNKNFFAVVATCADELCAVKARTYNYFPRGQAGQTPVRTQVCVFGDSANWEIDSDGFASTEFDLIGVLNHEIGHVLGLDERDNTVMDPEIPAASTRLRVVYEDDVVGMRARQNYNPISTGLIVRPLNGTQVQAPIVISSSYPWGRVGAALGESSHDGNDWVVRAAPSAAGVAAHFTRTQYPITSGSNWQNWSIGWTGGTWIAPAVVNGEGKFVAAWPNKTATANHCSGIRVMSTTNVFESVTEVSLPNDCTQHPVTLAYEQSTGRFIMLYVKHSNDSLRERIFARVSGDGVTWSAAQDMTIRTPSPVGLACSDQQDICLFAYTSRGLDAHTLTRGLATLSSSTVGITSTTSSYSQPGLHGPSVGTRTGTDPFALTFTNTNQELILEIDADAPVTPFDDVLSLLSPSFNSSGITATDALSRAYVFYTN
jgi:hypothetical protein